MRTFGNQRVCARLRARATGAWLPIRTLHEAPAKRTDLVGGDKERAGAGLCKAGPRRQNSAIAVPNRIAPMKLAIIRQNGVRAVTATCLACGYRADVVVDSLPDEMFVRDVGREMACAVCGGRRVSTRPAWHTLKRQGMG